VSGGATLTNTYGLFEDCWVWAYGQRAIASNFQAHNSVWRRVVVRGDGGGPSGGANPNIGIAAYNSQNVSFQNVIVIDRLLDAGTAYADFASAQHDTTNPDQNLFYLGGNEWLGCLSIASADAAFVWEADTAQPGMVTWTMRNCVAWPGGLSVQPGGGSASQDFCINVDNFTSYASTVDSIRIIDMRKAGYVKNSLAVNATRYGSNVVDSLTVPSYINVYNAASGNNGTAVTNLSAINPFTGTPNPLKYPTRIESASALSSVGSGGVDIGANVIYRYGADGLFHDDAGYNTLSTDLLWSWPNQDRIKSDMSAAYSSVDSTRATRGFCAAGETLTHYIWNKLSNGSLYV